MSHRDKKTLLFSLYSHPSPLAVSLPLLHHTTTMASSNKHWTSMFKSKPCINQWQHDHIIHQKNLACEERSPDPKPRWNPKPEQIRILDAIFNSGMVNPSRDEIRKIRLQLQEFGPVGDANVFYWFQNRKSRSKNKHSNVRNHLSPAAARRTPKPSPTASSSSSSSSSSAQSTDSGNKTLPLPTRFQYFAPQLPPPTLFPNQMNSLAEPAYQDAGIISSDLLYDPETPMQMQLLMGPDNEDHQECNLKMQYLQHLYAAAAAASASAVPTASATTVGSCVNGSPISDIQELMGEIGEGIFDAGRAAACTRSTVITGDAAYEVAAGRINIRQVFGPEAILLDQSGQPVLTDEWGVTLHPLQHGASYYLV